MLDFKIHNSCIFKVLYQGIESLKKITSLLQKSYSKQDVAEMMNSLYPYQRYGYNNPFQEMFFGFGKFFRQQKTPEPRIFCDVLIFAVDNGMYLIEFVIMLCMLTRPCSSPLIYIPKRKENNNWVH